MTCTCVIVPFGPQERAIIERHIVTAIEFMRREFRRANADELPCEEDDLSSLGFVETECLKQGEECAFAFACLAILGDILAHQHGCTWAVLQQKVNRDFVLCHCAFPEPLVLSRVHEYGGVPYDKGYDEPPDMSEIVSDVLECAERRIKIFRNELPTGEPVKPWRIAQSNQLGFECFPPRSEKVSG